MKKDIKIVRGSGGGGSSSSSRPYVPIEAENSLQANTYAKLVDLIAEGEIGGPANDDNWYKSTYLNEIPIQNEDGSYNFSGVTLDGKVGTSSQDYLDGFNGVENTNNVATAVTIAGGPISRTITDSDVDKVKITLSVPTLLSQASNGDLNKTTIKLKISVTPDNGAGTKQTVISPSIYGKCISEYRRQYVINNIAQYGSAPWVITVERTTADSGSAKLINAFSWYSYTTVIETKLRYYDRAVMGITINGSEFGNQMPTRAYKVNGRKISIPNNYDPDTRTYTGDWGGSFTTGVTNNPAWIVYDLLTDPDIGLGNILDASMVDKWSLYSCGQYCDETVSYTTRTENDSGVWVDSTSSEHRFSFNGVIENRTQALEVITHLCSVFRGYPVWAAGELTFVQDKPISTPARPVGISNVSEEGFEYNGIPKRARHSVVKVSWNDPATLGRLAVEEIVDEDAIISLGYNEKDFAAFGCTSKSEAIRRAKYVLDTDMNAREGVTFGGGLEWADVIPGDLLSVQDPNYASTVLEGRVMDSTANTTTSLMLDKDITFENGVTYTMLVQTATSSAEERELTNTSPSTSNILTWTTPLSNVTFVGAMLVISASNLETRKFIVVNVAEDDGKYIVAGLEYDPDKYARIEEGIIQETPPTTGLLPNALEPPTGLLLESYTYLEGDQLLRKYGIQLSWVHSIDPRTDYYELRYRPSDGGWIYLGDTVENNFDWKDVPGDMYDISVRSVGVGTVSEWLSYTDYTLEDSVSNIVPPTGVDTVEGGGDWSGLDCAIDWTASTGLSFDATSNVIFTHADVGDSNVDHYKVEVRKADTTLLRTAYTPPDALTYTYTYSDNNDDNDGVPLRSLLFYVYSIDTKGQSSTGYDSVAAINPAPDLSSTTPTTTPKYGYLRIGWTLSSDIDMSHYKIYLDESNPPTTLVGTVNHPTNEFDVQGLDYGTDYYCQIEPYDLFGVGTKSVVPSAAGPIQIPSINIDAELENSITMTDSDSNSAATLAKLYNGSFGSNGVSYTLSGTDKYIQYQYGIENYFDRLAFWTSNAAARVYIAYSTDGSSWSYLKADTSHNLSTDGYLVAATNQADAITNYWGADSTGLNIAMFPSNTVAHYIRLYMTGTWSTTIYEMVPSRILISELAAIEHLSSISADIGTIIAGEIRSSDGNTVFDLDNDVLTVTDASSVVRVKLGKLT